MKAQDLRTCLALAFPVMLAYVSIGIPCGVMEAQMGLTPLMALLFSATYYSGAGQFMVSGLWLSGVPVASIILSVSLVTTRQLLYSAAFAPFVGNERRSRSLAFAALVTDETFGVNLDRFSSHTGWNLAYARVVNVACMLSWAFANCLGAALGTVLDLPTDVMSFGMTAIFICLLVSQLTDSVTGCAAAVAAAMVALCKLLGFDGAAIFVGALAGVASGVIVGEVRAR
ncbi:MAG: AzlC family ABC transporter permease [Atopobiaceae bacterium]|nr:AzlC family ABC transporter permease [Atopobiaceae bacterium]